jgi:hypothetical protein
MPAALGWSGSPGRRWLLRPAGVGRSADYKINDFVHHHAKGRSSLVSSASSSLLGLVTYCVQPLTRTGELAPERTQQAALTRNHARACTRIDTHIRSRAHAHARTHTHTHTCAHSHSHSHSHKQTHTHKHTHTHQATLRSSANGLVCILYKYMYIDLCGRIISCVRQPC